MEELLNRMRFEADRIGRLKAKTRLGTITSYNPGSYSVKVLLQPDGTETGFIPLISPMIGNGWGVFFAPQVGDQVLVEFQEGGHEVPIATLRLFDNKNRPLSVPTGEMWLVHETGASIKLMTRGDIEISSPRSVSLTTPSVIASGNIAAIGNLSAGTGATGTFSSSTGQVITVSDGIVTNIF